MSGYRNCIGMDNSIKMIDRAKREFPKITFKINKSSIIPLMDKSVDVIFLFTVLTCIPLDADQDNLISEFRRILKKGGLIYISDLLLNSDNRNLQRYEKYRIKYNSYGVFELSEGVTLRHHSRDRIKQFTSGFAKVFHDEFKIITMNGNESNAFQLILKK